MILLSTLALAAPAVVLPQVRIRSHFGQSEQQRLATVAVADDVDLDGVTDGWAIFEGFGSDTSGGELIAGVFVEIGDELLL